jgi:hypothetical protein
MLAGSRRRCIACKSILKFDSSKTDMDKLKEMLEKLAMLQQNTKANA